MHMNSCFMFWAKCSRLAKCWAGKEAWLMNAQSEQTLSSSSHPSSHVAGKRRWHGQNINIFVYSVNFKWGYFIWSYKMTKSLPEALLPSCVTSCKCLFLLVYVSCEKVFAPHRLPISCSISCNQTVIQSPPNYKHTLKVWSRLTNKALNMCLFMQLWSSEKQ